MRCNRCGEERIRVAAGMCFSCLNDPHTIDKPMTVAQVEHADSCKMVKDLKGHCNEGLFADIAQRSLPIWVNRITELEPYL